MRILFDIGHPGHVHLLKNPIKALKEKHKVFITVKDIPVAKKLLKAEGFEFIEIGAKADSIAGKALSQLKYNLKVARLVYAEKIGLGVGTSITLPHVSKLTRMKSIVMDDDDDEVQPLFVKYGHPFADVILTPDAIKRRSKKTIYYPGTHELAYLHPDVFKPSPAVLQEAGLKEDDVFFIVRFVAFKGHHDVGHSGISYEQKKSLINMLSKMGRVLITSESPGEPEFEMYRLPVAPEKIHSLMYYASLFVGDSQTMTSEAALLGTPALKCNSFAGKLSVPNEMEHLYGLCFSFMPADFGKMLDKITSLLADPDTKREWAEKRNRFLRDKINVSAFFTWFIENYPASAGTLRQRPVTKMDFGHGLYN